MPYHKGSIERKRRHRKGRSRRVISFLQPCLLVMLHRGEAHGYSLLNGLDEFGFDPEQMDPSLVYRVLRELEIVEMVESEWDSNSLGPQRRVYKITLEGERHLAEWMEDLRRARKEIEALEATFEQVDAAERASQRGQGRMLGQKAAGPVGICICPQCGFGIEHKVAQPCYENKCPTCDIQLVRE